MQPPGDGGDGGQPPADPPPAPKTEPPTKGPPRPILSPPHEFITRSILVKTIEASPAPLIPFLLEYKRAGFLAGCRNQLQNQLEALGAAKRLTPALYNRIGEFATAMVARVYTAMWTRSRFISQKVLAFTPAVGWLGTQTHKLLNKAVVPAFLEHFQEAFGGILATQFDRDIVVVIHHNIHLFRPWITADWQVTETIR